MDKKNILVLETLDNHHHYVVTLTEVLNRNGKFNNFVLVTNNNYNLLKGDFEDFVSENDKKIFRYKTIINNNDKYTLRIISRLKQLKETIKIIKQNDIDIIFVNSMQAIANIFLIFYLLFSSKKTVLTIHDYIFRSKSKRDRVLATLMKPLIKKSAAVIFFTDYLKVDKIFENKEKIYLDYAYDRQHGNMKKYEKLTFALLCVPDDNKDYNIILKSFSNLIRENNKLITKIKIIFPLKMRSKKIVESIKFYGLEKITEYHNNYVPEKQYATILKKSHYCIIPSASDKSFGKRRISASFSYGCAYMLPIIIPSIYFTNNKKTPYSYTYSNEKELTNVLKSLIGKKYDPDFVKKQFKEYNHLFSFDNVNKKINSIFC